MGAPGPGHNADGATMTIEARLFNSLSAFRKGQVGPLTLALEAGSTVGDVADRVGVPRDAIHLAFHNGRPLMVGGPGPALGVLFDRALDDGDVVAFSGPAPFSWGYGAPVV